MGQDPFAVVKSLEQRELYTVQYDIKTSDTLRLQLDLLLSSPSVHKTLKVFLSY